MLKLKTYKQNPNEFVSEKPKTEKNTKYTENNFENVDMKNDFKKKSCLMSAKKENTAFHNYLHCFFRSFFCVVIDF